MENIEIKYIINKPSLFKSFIETISSIVDETNFVLTKKGIAITGIDPSRIAIINLSIGKSFFDDIIGDSNEFRENVGLNMDDLKKIFNRIRGEPYKLIFSYDKFKQMVFIQSEEESMKRTFKLCCLDLEIEDVPMENLHKMVYENEILVDNGVFLDILADSDIYSEIINLELKEPDLFCVRSIGQIGEYNLEMNIDEPITIPKHSAYSIAFLKGFFSSLKKYSSKLYIENDVPLKIFIEFDDDTSLYFYVAPRVEKVDFDVEEFNLDDEEVEKETEITEDKPEVKEVELNVENIGIDEVEEKKIESVEITPLIEENIEEMGGNIWKETETKEVNQVNEIEEAYKKEYGTKSINKKTRKWKKFYRKYRENKKREESKEPNEM